MKLRASTALCILACLLTPLSALAEDTLASVVSRLQVKQASTYSYTEKRQIQLLSAPWEGSGVMYLSPETMVIEQRAPKHSIIVIADNKMRYVEPQNDVLYVKKLKRSFDLPGMGSFLQLVYGQSTLAELEDKFEIAFVSNVAEWSLSLTLRDPKRVQGMKLVGPVGEAARELTIHFIDGDLSSWTMVQHITGEPALKAMNKVLALATSVKPNFDPAER